MFYLISIIFFQAFLILKTFLYSKGRVSPIKREAEGTFDKTPLVEDVSFKTISHQDEGEEVEEFLAFHQ